jgi:hypothetical protein
VTTRKLAATSAAIEATTGAALIADPGLVVRLLLDASLSGGGIAVGRVCGFGLLALAFACWPNDAVVSASAASGLFTYNLLTALYLGYLGATGSFSGYLLWPACVLHAVFAFLLARPEYEAIRRRWPGGHFPQVSPRH